MRAYLKGKKDKFRKKAHLLSPDEKETSRPSSEQASPAPSINPAAVSCGTPDPTSDSDLWKLAYQNLQADKCLKLVIEEYETILQDVVEKSKEDQSESKISNAEGLPEGMALVVQSNINIMNTKQWKFQWRGKSITVRDKVNSLVKFMKAISGPVSAAANLNPYAGLAWSGVCFLLPLILNDSDQLTQALEGIEIVTKLIYQYRIIENVYVDYTQSKEKGGLRDSMISLYQNILAYQVKAACYYNLKTAKRTFANITKKDDWMDLIGKINDCHQTCQEIIGVMGFTLIQTAFKEHDQKLENILKEVRNHDAENERIATWISNFPVEIEHDDVRNNSLGSRYWSSGNWLLKNNTFSQWEASRSGTFWLRGPVGTGKTCAVCITIEHFFKTATSARLAFFYCSKTRHSAELNDPKVVLGSLLAQLSYSTDGESILSPIKAKFNEQRERRRNGAELSQQECTELLIEVTKLNKQTIIVIDALDEGPGGQSSELLSSLRRISNESPAVKVFFSSRMEVRVNQYFQDAMVISQENSEDIKRFIVGEFFAPRRLVSDEVKTTIRDQYGYQGSSIQTLNPANNDFQSGMTSEQGTRLIKALMDRAHGMFRWVELQLDIFLKPDNPICVDEDFEEKLCALELDSPSKLPALDKAYDQTFHSNIPPADQKRAREYAIRALKWTLCSPRPLTLEELAYAISDDGSAKALKENLILQYCSNFIIQNSQGHAQFAHFSVSQYLEQRGPEFSGTAANILAATTCVSYLSCPDPQFSGVFGRYATVYWPLHYKNASSNKLSKLENGVDISYSKGEEKIEQFLFNGHDTSISFIQWVSSTGEVQRSLSYDEQRLVKYLDQVSSTPPTPLFLASALGLISITGHLKSLKNTDWNQRNTKDVSALYLAAKNGHKEVVQLLYEQGAELEAKNNEWTALYVAARYGHEAVVRLLLEKGAELEAKDSDGWTALYIAATYGHEAVVRLLLEKGAELEAKDNNGSTALYMAATYGDEAVVRLLLEKGAELEAKDNNRSTALHIAARYGREAVVRLLLEKGAEPEAKDNNGSTALYMAATYGDEAVVRLLLEKGAELEAKDNNRSTALHIAARYGREAVVRLLLEKGAEPEAKDNNGSTALHIAARYGREAVVRLLLEKGAEPEAKDNNGSTALHMAATYGDEAVVRLLLEKGAELEAKDNNGSTALHIAARYGREAVVQLLLEKEAELEAKDNNGSTALHMAARYGREAVVQLLLEKRADIKAKDYNGSTAAELAASRGHENIEQLLETFSTNSKSN